MSRFQNTLLYAVALVVSVWAAVGRSDEQDPQPLLVLDGEAVSAAIEELTPDWGITVWANGEQKKLQRSDYVSWGSYSDQDRSSQVLLTDGSVLVGDLVQIEVDSITIASRLWGEVSIDRRLVRACLMLPATDPLKRDRQWQSLRDSGSTDRVLLLNGDAITGNVLPTTVRDGGGLFGLVSLGIELSSGGARRSIRVEEVHAITFRTQTQPTAQAECLLGFRDGSLVVASELTRADPDLTRINTAGGATVQLQTDKFRTSLVFIQPENERVAYLSDLPAVGYKSLPLLELEWPLGVDHNTLGGALRSGGNVIFKGLGMHSTSRVAYNLDRSYRRFQAELALDDYAGRQGSVVYRVLVERENDTGQRSWSLAFTSPIIRGGDTPLAITLDVTDASRLALVIEMADRADTRDYANWLNARLLR